MSKAGVKLVRLKELREKNGLTQDAVAKHLKITRAAYTNIELGKREPELKTFEILADLFGVSLFELLGVKAKTIPVLGIIRAGLPILAEENYAEEISVGQFEKSADFALRVIGDSMVYAGIWEGDIVLFQKTESAFTGQIVAAIVNDMDCRATLKYFIEGKQPVLRAANPNYEDQLITSNHRIVGVYSGLVRTDEPSIHECEELVARSDALNKEWKGVMLQATEMGWSADGIISMMNAMRNVKK